jgi:hypothetical protein
MFPRGVAVHAGAAATGRLTALKGEEVAPRTNELRDIQGILRIVRTAERGFDDDVLLMLEGARGTAAGGGGAFRHAIPIRNESFHLLLDV